MLADTSMEVVLGMPFFPFSNADMGSESLFGEVT